eukprot:4856035-Prymnesium_polylepis.2
MLSTVPVSASPPDARSRNNHHFRIAPYERQLRWCVDLGIYPPSHTSDFNLLPGVPKFELSHHLAHAWS